MIGSDQLNFVLNYTYLGPEASYHETEWTRGGLLYGTACFVKTIRLYIRTFPNFDSEWFIACHRSLYKH